MWDYYYALTTLSTLTERIDILKSRSEDGHPPIGMLQKREPDRISLRYSLPADPALAAFVMGVMAAERELVFVCQGFQFASEGRLTWAPTASGFMERREPVFLYNRPILRLR